MHLLATTGRLCNRAPRPPAGGPLESFTYHVFWVFWVFWVLCFSFFENEKTSKISYSASVEKSYFDSRLKSFPRFRLRMMGQIAPFSPTKLSALRIELGGRRTARRTARLAARRTAQRAARRIVQRVTRRAERRRVSQFNRGSQQEGRLRTLRERRSLRSGGRNCRRSGLGRSVRSSQRRNLRGSLRNNWRHQYARQGPHGAESSLLEPRRHYRRRIAASAPLAGQGADRKGCSILRSQTLGNQVRSSLKPRFL